MSIKIYSCNDSRGLRPMWTAEEMGLSYETEMMPFPTKIFAQGVHGCKHPWHYPISY